MRDFRSNEIFASLVYDFCVQYTSLSTLHRVGVNRHRINFRGRLSRYPRGCIPEIDCLSDRAPEKLDKDGADALPLQSLMKLVS